MSKYRIFLINKCFYDALSTKKKVVSDYLYPVSEDTKFYNTFYNECYKTEVKGFQEALNLVCKKYNLKVCTFSRCVDQNGLDRDMIIFEEEINKQ